MGWIETAKEKGREHIILGLFALIALLLLIIWRAVPSPVWDTVSEVTPKRVLWALLGLEAITVCVLTALFLDYRRKHKNTPTTIPSLPLPPTRRFGIHWDSQQNPLCPLDDVLLPMIDKGIYEHLGQPYELFKCPKCKTQFQLRDDSGRRVMIVEAKAILAIEKASQ